MPSRSSSKNTSERAPVLNAAAADFSPNRATILQPANMDTRFVDSGDGDFVPGEYVEGGEESVTLKPDALTAYVDRFTPLPDFQLTEHGVSQMQKETHILQTAHGLALGLCLEIGQLKEELNAIRESNRKRNGNENTNTVGEGGEESPPWTGKENQDVNGSIEETEKPDAEAVVGKKIIAFLRLTKDTPYPHRLYCKDNYANWRESILSIAESTGCSYIIDNGQKFSPFTDENTYLWGQQNDWLYNLIWDSIDSQAMEAVTQPTRRSAYLLWNQLESTFRRPLEEERRSIFQNLYPSQKTSDREYIKQFQEARRKLEKLGFPVPDWLLYDILYEGVSSASQDIIHANFKLKQEETPKSIPQTLDIDILIDELVACLPSEGNTIISTISASDSNTDLSPNQSPLTLSNDMRDGIVSVVASKVSNDGDVSTRSGTTRSTSKKKKENNRHQSSNSSNTSSSETIKCRDSSRGKEERGQSQTQTRTRPDPSVKCEFCTRPGHTQSACYIKNPELGSERWRRQNQQTNEFFRQKAIRERQQQNRNPSGPAQQEHNKNRGRTGQRGSNQNSNSNSKPETAIASPTKINMSQRIEAIARQFYEQMDNEV
ncbi:hypothetical protein BDDG_05584 [Blastomyces dermatitidis ATCC 18188]|uniref:Uncharacterized protein n=1 Tax=Ajellomyces dermatitidis (strain ATCC 18188 / CBS 674.68) TaxID=653446 RepID=F2THC7_AJEDA|nr:hypothetical protein BDDG_05584 [Blastomyces dermatitidis ATCC 18188]